MIVLGIDPGYSNIGVAVLIDKDLKYYSHYSPCSMSECFNWASDLIKTYKPDLVCIEKAFYPFNSKVGSKIYEYIAILKLVCELASVETILKSPKTIKKEFTGNGKASKQAIIEKVKKYYNIDLTNDHIADSIAIAHVGTI